MFARALTSTPEPRPGLGVAQVAAVAAGASAIAAGRVLSVEGLLVVGGVSWIAGIAMLGWIVWRAWVRSIHRRHPVPIAAYGLALCFAILGGLAGAMLGSGTLGATAYVALRRMHPTLNVLGFASLTIVGTLVTLLPTILRVRMVAWRGGLVVGLLAAGVALQAMGWAFAARWVVAAGGIAGAAGAITLGIHVAMTIRVPRRFAVPTAAMHLLAGIVWFIGGSIWLAVQLWRGPIAVDLGRSTFLGVFVCGWLVQILLGAWAYLLPMARPGGPQEHRAGLQVFEVLGRTQVVAFNTGVFLLVASRWLPPSSSAAGWCLALTAVLWALTKTWAFPVLAGRLSAGPRGAAVWAA
jgi:nitrite reductase (NO-forming)